MLKSISFQTDKHFLESSRKFENVVSDDTKTQFVQEFSTS